METKQHVDDLISTAEVCEYVGESVYFHGTSKDALAANILAANIRAVVKDLEEARERERVAIASWDEERQRALREATRVTRLVTLARDMLSTFREDDKTTLVTAERQEAWHAELDAVFKT